MGQQMVGESYRLGSLQVGVARQKNIHVGPCAIDQSSPEACQRSDEPSTLFTNPKANIGGDLIVSTTSRVQLFTHRPHLFHQASFDVHVNIFQGFVPRKVARSNLPLDGLKPLEQSAEFAIGEKTHGVKHARMGTAAA
jgi:hypothetical protein